jgi:hypothetical protein
VKKEELELTIKVKAYFEDGCAWNVTNDEMLDYLKANKLATQGNRGELADRIMLYISHSYDSVD